MATTSVASALNAAATPPTTTPSSSSSSGNTLGQADFLKLLSTQMQNQDPLNPMSSTDFVAQLSQFSMLSGIQQLNQSFTSLLQLQQLTQGVGLIGKTVTYSKTATGATSQGTVDSINLSNGTLQLMIGGSAVTLDQVRGVTAPARAARATTTS